MRKVFATVFAPLCGSVTAPLMAQTEATQKIAQPEKSTSTNIVSDFVSDQKDIGHPLHIKRGDVEWLASIAVRAVALSATAVKRQRPQKQRFKASFKLDANSTVHKSGNNESLKG